MIDAWGRENAMGNRYAGVKQIDKVLRLGKTRAAPWRAAPCRLPFPPALLPNDPTTRPNGVARCVSTLLQRSWLRSMPRHTARHHTTTLCSTDHTQHHTARHHAAPRETTSRYTTAPRRSLRSLRSWLTRRTHLLTQLAPDLGQPRLPILALCLYPSIPEHLDDLGVLWGNVSGVGDVVRTRTDWDESGGGQKLLSRIERRVGKMRRRKGWTSGGGERCRATDCGQRITGEMGGSGQVCTMRRLWTFAAPEGRGNIERRGDARGRLSGRCSEDVGGREGESKRWPRVEW